MAAFFLLIACSAALSAQARERFHTGPVPVRYSEGTVHGFLEIRLAKQPPSTTGAQTVKVT